MGARERRGSPQRLGLLILVIEHQPEAAAKGGQRTFGGIGFGRLEGALMGVRQPRGGRVAKARSFANNLDGTGPNPDRHAREIATCKAIRRTMLEAALKMDHLAIPTVKAKDPVGLLDDKPALDVSKRLAILFAALHALLIERGGELLELMTAKADAHRVETTI